MTIMRLNRHAMTRVRNGGNKIGIARTLLVCNGFCTLSSSDEAAQVSSVPLKQWAAELVQAFHNLTSSLCSSMTQYLIIHQRSLIILLLLVCYLGQGFCYREKGIMSPFIQKVRFTKFAKMCNITSHGDHVPFRTHFNGSILSYYILLIPLATMLVVQ